MAQVVDPVCQMVMKAEEAKATREWNGGTYLFCSRTCASVFDKDPTAYA